MALMMAQMRQKIGGGPQQAQGVSAAGQQGQQIGPQNQFANARSIQPGGSGPQAAQFAGQAKAAGGDQFSKFQQQLGNGLNVNLSSPTRPPEGLGSRLNVQA